jgi:SAM-dependent methyltransferase
VSGYTYHDYAHVPDPPHQPLYLEKMLVYLRASEPPVRTILDAGSGDGNFAASLADEGFEMYGVDLSESGVRIAQERGIGKFAQRSLYEDLRAPFGVPSYDAIISVEVIEHLYDPRRFIALAHEALRPEGLFLLTTPYWGYLKNVVVAVAGRMDRRLTALWDGGHIKHWSRATLTELVSEQPFDVVGFEGCGRPVPFLWNGMLMTFRARK